MEAGGLVFLPTLLKQSPAILSRNGVERVSRITMERPNRDCERRGRVFDKTIEKLTQKKKMVRNFPKWQHLPCRTERLCK